MGFAILHGVDSHFSNPTICDGQCLNHTSIGPVIPVQIHLQQNDVTDTMVAFHDLPPYMGLQGWEKLFVPSCPEAISQMLYTSPLIAEDVCRIT